MLTVKKDQSKPVILPKSNNRKWEVSFLGQFVKNILLFKKHTLNYRKGVTDKEGDSDI